MIVLESLQSLWMELETFSPNTLMGLVEEAYYGKSWYNYHKRIKAGSHGLNSGTVLFDLSKARLRNTTTLFSDILLEIPAPSDFVLGDQDVLNVAFAREPELYKPLPCRWNRRLEGCLLMEDLGLSPGILHGNRDVLYAKEDWTDQVSVLHRAAFTVYTNLLIQDGAWCVPMVDATPGSKCADIEFGPSKNITFYKDGELLQGTSGKDVYIMHGGLRHAFAGKFTLSFTFFPPYLFLFFI